MTDVHQYFTVNFIRLFNIITVFSTVYLHDKLIDCDYPSKEHIWIVKWRGQDHKEGQQDSGWKMKEQTGLSQNEMWREGENCEVWRKCVNCITPIE